MSSAVLEFGDKYFEYREKGIKTKGLEIGGYESYFLAYLVASYLFEKCNNQFNKVLQKGIYRDNGLLVFEGNKSHLGIKIWRDVFQSMVNKSSINELLQHTCDLCIPNTLLSRNKYDDILEIITHAIPYLEL